MPESENTKKTVISDLAMLIQSKNLVRVIILVLLMLCYCIVVVLKLFKNCLFCILQELLFFKSEKKFQNSFFY